MVFALDNDTKIEWVMANFCLASATFVPINNLPVVQCEPEKADKELANAPRLQGKLAWCRRGGCEFVEKAQRASSAGAAGLVVVNDDDGLFKMGGSGFSSNIPVIMIRASDGQRLLAHGHSSCLASSERPPASGFSSKYSLTDSDGLNLGSQVRIKGLVIGGHLNGQLGEIVEIRGSGSSAICTDYHVLMRFNGKKEVLKAHNLQAVKTGEIPVFSVGSNAGRFETVDGRPGLEDKPKREQDVGERHHFTAETAFQPNSDGHFYRSKVVNGVLTFVRV